MLIPEELYRAIRESIPIPCVDLLVIDQAHRVLLLRRANQPAKGLWWLPGGRVHFGETREAAVNRKLHQECALEALALRELATLDLLLEVPGERQLSHGITTVYRVDVDRPGALRLDSQSTDAAWHSVNDWRCMDLHPFVLRCLMLD